MKSWIIPFALAALLAGCKQETPPNKPPLPKTDAPAQGSRLPERTQAGIDALNKSKQVEGVVQKQASEQEQAINRQAGQ